MCKSNELKRQLDSLHDDPVLVHRWLCHPGKNCEDGCDIMPIPERLAVYAEAEFYKGLKAWLERAQKICDDYMEKNFPTLSKTTLYIQEGSKYIKIIKGDSVYCFIDRSNGDVLKAANWRHPAKHARGNIFDTDRPGVNHYGGLYLRGSA